MPKPGTIERISDANKAVLYAIRAYLDTHGYSPSIRDIRDETGMSSTSLVFHHLDRLERLGVIERDRYVARSIRICQPSECRQYQPNWEAQ